MTGRVSININGRKYGLGCEEGEQERLMRLGQKLDDRVNAMANQFGQIGDIFNFVQQGNSRHYQKSKMSELLLKTGSKRELAKSKKSIVRSSMLLSKQKLKPHPACATPPCVLNASLKK